jgi:hypothetical protein
LIVVFLRVFFFDIHNKHSRFGFSLFQMSTAPLSASSSSSSSASISASSSPSASSASSSTTSSSSSSASSLSSDEKEDSIFASSLRYQKELKARQLQRAQQQKLSKQQIVNVPSASPPIATSSTSSSLIGPTSSSILSSIVKKRKPESDDDDNNDNVGTKKKQKKYNSNATESDDDDSKKKQHSDSDDDDTEDSDANSKKKKKKKNISSDTSSTESEEEQTHKKKISSLLQSKVKKTKICDSCGQIGRILRKCANNKHWVCIKFCVPYKSTSICPCCLQSNDIGPVTCQNCKMVSNPTFRFFKCSRSGHTFCGTCWNGRPTIFLLKCCPTCVKTSTCFTCHKYPAKKHLKCYCGHLFCKKCVLRTRTKAIVCPTCVNQICFTCGTNLKTTSLIHCCTDCKRYYCKTCMTLGGTICKNCHYKKQATCQACFGKMFKCSWKHLYCPNCDKSCQQGLCKTKCQRCLNNTSPKKQLCKYCNSNYCMDQCFQKHKCTSGGVMGGCIICDTNTRFLDCEQCQDNKCTTCDGIAWIQDPITLLCKLLCTDCQKKTTGSAASGTTVNSITNKCSFCNQAAGKTLKKCTVCNLYWCVSANNSCFEQHICMGSSCATCQKQTMFRCSHCNAYDCRSCGHVKLMMDISLNQYTWRCTLCQKHAFKDCYSCSTNANNTISCKICGLWGCVSSWRCWQKHMCTGTFEKCQQCNTNFTMLKCQTCKKECCDTCLVLDVKNDSHQCKTCVGTMGTTGTTGTSGTTVTATVANSMKCCDKCLQNRMDIVTCKICSKCLCIHPRVCWSTHVCVSSASFPVCMCGVYTTPYKCQSCKKNCCTTCMVFNSKNDTHYCHYCEACAQTSCAVCQSRTNVSPCKGCQVPHCIKCVSLLTLTCISCSTKASASKVAASSSSSAVPKCQACQQSTDNICQRCCIPYCKSCTSLHTIYKWICVHCHKDLSSTSSSSSSSLSSSTYEPPLYYPRLIDMGQGRGLGIELPNDRIFAMIKENKQNPSEAYDDPFLPWPISWSTELQKVDNYREQLLNSLKGDETKIQLFVALEDCICYVEQLKMKADPKYVSTVSNVATNITYMVRFYWFSDDYIKSTVAVSTAGPPKPVLLAWETPSTFKKITDVKVESVLEFLPLIIPNIRYPEQNEQAAAISLFFKASSRMATNEELKTWGQFPFKKSANMYSQFDINGKCVVCGQKVCISKMVCCQQYDQARTKNKPNLLLSNLKRPKPTFQISPELLLDLILPDFSVSLTTQSVTKTLTSSSQILQLKHPGILFILFFFLY